MALHHIFTLKNKNQDKPKYP
uniref:Uncharacterized protein n=1 Tax=Rhizophora mucronata TaxID=61149 RepID=A0A2P2PAV2_RHIMU